MRGIFIYEPLFKYNILKYHKYLIDISFYFNQLFMFLNIEQ